MKPKKLLVVGGVAGGASCAEQARRLSEEAEIIVYLSFLFQMTGSVPEISRRIFSLWRA
jgi:NADPH-dependent 2,4-dienoyl-CoA reductase/sulfur reductase-like enzyme